MKLGQLRSAFSTRTRLRFDVTATERKMVQSALVATLIVVIRGTKLPDCDRTGIGRAERRKLGYTATAEEILKRMRK